MLYRDNQTIDSITTSFSNSFVEGSIVLSMLDGCKSVLLLMDSITTTFSKGFVEDSVNSGLDGCELVLLKGKLNC